jgi:hypothetical protein
MQHEPLARLQSIHQELLSTAAEFWEFTDRGENFHYLEPALWPCAARVSGTESLELLWISGASVTYSHR